MKIRAAICAFLVATSILTVGCRARSGEISDTSSSIEETETYIEIQSFVGESASFGNMTFTVHKAIDPCISMGNGNMVVFFDVTVENGTDETVPANYLNNFSVTVDGAYAEANECCTIPAMKKLYDAYNTEAINEEIPAGESRKGYVACEVDSGFRELILHYTPKTTDRRSMISVSVSFDEFTREES